MSKHKIKQQVLYFSSSYRYDHLSNFNLKGIFKKKKKQKKHDPIDSVLMFFILLIVYYNDLVQ